MAYFGRFGCDVPAAMVDRAFEKMAIENPDLGFIIMPGDIVGHMIPIDLKEVKDITQEAAAERYQLL